MPIYLGENAVSGFYGQENDNAEDKKNKVTAIDEGNKESATKYPSVSAVVNYLTENLPDGNAEKSENKLSEFSEDDKTSTEKYPSSKAVWDTFLPRTGGTITGTFTLSENQINFKNNLRNLRYQDDGNIVFTDIEWGNFIALDAVNKQFYFNNNGEYYHLFGEHNMKELQLLTSVIDVTSEDGVNYTAVNAPDIPLRHGMKITVRPNKTSTGTPTIDAFGSGALQIYNTGYGYLGTGYSSSVGWVSKIASGSVIELMYDATRPSWFAVSGMSLRVQDVSDTSFSSLRNIYAGTTDMTSSSTALTSGRIYLQYE